MNEVRGDAEGPFPIQRQCDELGSVLTVRRSNIYCATTTSTPETIDDQVQTTRVTIDLCVVQPGPTGAIDVYWLIQFDAQAL